MRAKWSFQNKKTYIKIKPFYLSLSPLYSLSLHHLCPLSPVRTTNRNPKPTIISLQIGTLKPPRRQHQLPPSLSPYLHPPLPTHPPATAEVHR
ncbi:hypothetical protein HanHA300_Chr13g0471221 [Helianthus annuus]|nr:hypothetical protein HanHA300_Chr13g0471221 [Helianthus annuus]KAJ0662767.1 hypothetical protein HanLR1_Chr13g0473411 [Helianthus annuus]